MMYAMVKKFRLRPGGMIMLSALVFLLDVELLVLLLLNVLIHEWGHLFMLRRCGVYVRKIVLDFGGLCILCNTDHLSPRAGFMCALFGPLFGMAGACAASFAGNVLGNELLLLSSGIGVVLTLFNLIPIKPLDGWRMLAAAFPDSVSVVSTIFGTLTLMFGLCLMFMGYGTAPACLAVFLLLQDLRGKF